MALDKLILDFIHEYQLAVHHMIFLSMIIGVFVAICGAIRFGIAIRRRAKGIYPPAASQMEEH